MDLSLLDALPPERILAAIPAFLTDVLSDRAVAARARADLTTEIAGWRSDEGLAVLAHLRALGDAQRVYHAEPRCQRVARIWCAHVLGSPRLDGVDHLEAALAAGPTVIVCNHLSYLDTLGADWALTHHGRADLAERVVTVAGPKVYETLFRRFATAGLHTLPVPQSSSVATDPDAVSPRELARMARESVDAGRAALASGAALQVYAEGSRSRSGHLQPFLRGVHRYLAPPVRQVVPAAIHGTERVFPVDSISLHPGPITLTYAAPIDVDAVGGAREALSAAHCAIADLLPAPFKPDPDSPPIR